jgi:hypothetical protein
VDGCSLSRGAGSLLSGGSGDRQIAICRPRMACLACPECCSLIPRAPPSRVPAHCPACRYSRVQVPSRICPPIDVDMFVRSPWYSTTCLPSAKEPPVSCIPAALHGATHARKSIYGSMVGWAAHRRQDVWEAAGYPQATVTIPEDRVAPAGLLRLEGLLSARPYIPWKSSGIIGMALGFGCFPSSRRFTSHPGLRFPTRYVPGQRSQTRWRVND